MSFVRRRLHRTLSRCFLKRPSFIWHRSFPPCRTMMSWPAAETRDRGPAVPFQLETASPTNVAPLPIHRIPKIANLHSTFFLEYRDTSVLAYWTFEASIRVASMNSPVYRGWRPSATAWTGSSQAGRGRPCAAPRGPRRATVDGRSLPPRHLPPRGRGLRVGQSSPSHPPRSPDDAQRSGRRQQGVPHR